MVEVYHPAANKWVVLPEMTLPAVRRYSTAVSRHTSSGLHQAVYVIGGEVYNAEGPKQVVNAHLQRWKARTRMGLSALVHTNLSPLDQPDDGGGGAVLPAFGARMLLAPGTKKSNPIPRWFLMGGVSAPNTISPPPADNKNNYNVWDTPPRTAVYSRLAKRRVVWGLMLLGRHHPPQQQQQLAVAVVAVVAAVVARRLAAVAEGVFFKLSLPTTAATLNL